METTCFDTVKKWFKSASVLDRLARVLPRNTGVDAWVEAALVQARGTRGIGYPLGKEDSAVQYADPASVLGAAFIHATLGLRHEGPLGQAYFQCSPKKQYDKNTQQWRVVSIECTAGVGYKGLCALAYQDPQVREPEAVLVYEGDDFVAVKGSTPRLEHTINVQGTSRRIVAAYAGLRYRDGYYSFQPFRGVDLADHRQQVLMNNHNWEIEVDATGQEVFYETWNGKRKLVPDSKVRSNPWAAHGPAMIQKTALRWASKYWNLGPKFDTAAGLLALEEAGVSQQLAAAGRAVLAQPEAPVDVHAGNPALVAQLVAEATVRDPATGDGATSPMTSEEIAEALARERAEVAIDASDQLDPLG